MLLDIQICKRLCKSCAEKHVEEEIAMHAELICEGKGGCGKNLGREAFSQRQLDRGKQRLCKNCIATPVGEENQKYAELLCAGRWGCGKTLPRAAFSKTQLDQKQNRLCKKCVTDSKTCGKCGRSLPSRCYVRCKSQTPSYMRYVKRRRCDECLAEFDEELRRTEM